jgi:hypothetical protein
MIKITKKTVVANDGNFEEHPESYKPRILVAVMPTFDASVADPDPPAKVYELLTDGQVIPWPCLPQKEFCGFDFWTIYADSIHDITMNRAEFVRMPKIPGHVWAALQEAQTEAERVSGSIPQADGDSGSLSLDHLPEGSH